MDFFSNSKPDLVGPKVKKSVFKIIKTGGTINATISDKISSLIESIYKDYISEYKLIVVIMVVIVIFLLYRYYSKDKTAKVKQEEKEKFSPEEERIINQIMNEQTADLKYDKQPSFNPLYSVNEQQKDNVNYPPEPLPINLPGKGIVMTQNPYNNYPAEYQNLNTPIYDYNAVYKYPNRSYYSGTYDTYKGAQDTSIINPFGWSNDFNTNTGAFVSGMTGANRQNVVDYQTMLDTMEANLIDGLRVGPDHLADVPEVDPPYAD